VLILAHADGGTASLTEGIIKDRHAWYGR
jgi:hypothetical protein